MKFNEDKVTDTESYFVIVVTNRRKRPDGTFEDYQLFFKSNRYTPYSGSLQVEWHHWEGRKWKTAEGACKALKKLQSKNTIKEHHKAVVCKYTKVVTVRFDIVTEKNLNDQKLTTKPAEQELMTEVGGFERLHQAIS